MYGDDFNFNFHPFNRLKAPGFVSSQSALRYNNKCTKIRSPTSVAELFLPYVRTNKGNHRGKQSETRPKMYK